ncbi:fimbria/pilus periplasmic chaperone [Providencia rustigianii]|uniref:fimbria/pilus periplasmic chaperone n=1 Tax=Providencia rustigianii TaxID=158850 RepID=UPI000F6C5096|nr:fimbria/pilus periplasmic chaperone [Providencia rustigianii]MTC61469.1 fimbria/pilus periplasmic chaperone [Providencia rustigianii]VEH56749.1 putative fimbrial chaperone protein [Providencia rustigianii]
MTKIENTVEDTEDLITVFPPVTRVDGNDTQTVRFLLTSKTPIKTERLKRASFEGVPPKNKVLEKEINVTFKQNIPVIIRPIGLKKNDSPWKELKWSINGKSIVVINPSPYVVRFTSLNASIIPTGQMIMLPKSYILPNQSFTLEIPSNFSKLDSELNNVSIRFHPATIWGFSTSEAYDAPVK